jgi:hypothetical protein
VLKTVVISKAWGTATKNAISEDKTFEAKPKILSQILQEPHRSSKCNLRILVSVCDSIFKNKQVH